MRAQSGIAAAKLTGVLPLDIILAVAAGGDAAAGITDRQLQAAIAAAPYLQPKRAAVADNDLTPPDPELEAKRARLRSEVIQMLTELARPEPLVIESETGVAVPSEDGAPRIWE